MRNVAITTIRFILFFPFYLLYRIAFAFDKTFSQKSRLDDAITISIGNLSVGGTGKTPFVIFLGKLLQTFWKGTEIVVLSRGYGGKKSPEGMEVQIDSDTLDSGEEPLLIKNNLENAKVLIGRNRKQVYGRFFPPKMVQNVRKIVLLDDGFQHHKLQRDLDIVLIDSNALLGNGFTLPIGFLREPVSALERAHAVIFTKISPENEKSRKVLEEKIRKKFPNLQIFHSREKFSFFQNQKGEKLDLEKIRDKKIFAYSGIGNPKTFFGFLQSLNPKEILERKFVDHQEYSLALQEKILREASPFEYILTTEKDFLKWNLDSSKIYFLKMEVELLELEEFSSFLSKTFQEKGIFANS